MGMAPLFESGKMQVRPLPPQFVLVQSMFVLMARTLNLYFCGGIGRRGRLKICLILWVRLPPEVLTGCGAVVARLLWEQDVAGSNPVIPIHFSS
jgi:hypothetical protein